MLLSLVKYTEIQLPSVDTGILVCPCLVYTTVTHPVGRFDQSSPHYMVQICNDLSLCDNLQPVHNDIVNYNSNQIVHLGILQMSGEQLETIAVENI